MTAVEWLESQIKNSKHYFNLMKEINSRVTIAQPNVFEQAKAMEKEQIVCAVDGFPISKRHLNGEEYYNEIYKK